MFLWCACYQVKRVVVYLGRDKTMQLLEELMCELDLTDPVSSAVTHMDNPPYYRITSSYKIPSVTSGKFQKLDITLPIYSSFGVRWLMLDLCLHRNNLQQQYYGARK